jgi:histidinol phosphatase-like enzyme (inositol monophosphatase family)
MSTTALSASHSNQDLLDFALDLARESAALVLPFYRKPLQIEDKNLGTAAGFDPVTQADRAVEEMIRARVEARFPAHGIIGEEFGASRPDADYQWVIDPIDGTRAFMMGLPTWGTLIGLTHQGKPALGVMGQPFTGELFWSTGTGAFTSGPLGTFALQVRQCAGLSTAIMGCTSPSLFKTDSELARFQRVAAQTRMMRYGGDCYVYALVAAGQVDLVIEAGLQSFDVAALIPIIEQAGGIMTTWSGGPAVGGGQIIAAGDKRVYDQAMALLRP